jgi:glycerol-3-phosphate acyltransferase PlsX
MRSIVKALFGAIGAPQYKEHADAIMPALLDVYSIFDPDSTGGAILLGVDGVCIISHGSSSARAMLNGIKVAQEMVDSNMVGLIAEALQSK